MKALTATQALEMSRDRAGTGKPEAEEYDSVVIESATAFVAAMKSGQGKNLTSERPDLLGAGCEALLMERAYVRPKQAVVYAVLPSGSTTLVPRRLWADLVDRAEKWCQRGGRMETALRFKPNFDLMPVRKKR